MKVVVHKTGVVLTLVIIAGVLADYGNFWTALACGMCAGLYYLRTTTA